MADIDPQRLLAVELCVKGHDGEIASLRASRHEYGNWLNRHNLEINALQTACSQNEEVAKELGAIMKAHDKALNELKGDVQILAWKIGAIIGGLVIAGNVALKYVHF